MSTLSVNTIKPASGDTVAVSGTLSVSGTLKAEVFETATYENTTYAGTTTFGNDVGDDHQFTGSIYISGAASTGLGNALLVQSGKVGIGTTDPNFTLGVTGTLGVSGNSTFSSPITVAGNISGSGNATIVGNVYTDANLNVSGSSTLKGNVATLGNLSGSGNATIVGNVYTDANLLVSGSTTLGKDSSKVATVTSQLTASQGALIPTALKLNLRDTGIFINSSTDGQLDIVSDGLTKASGPFEIENPSDGGAPALIIDNDDVDQVALQIEGAPTSAAAPQVLIDTNNASTAGVVIPVSLQVDYDKTGATGGGALSIANGVGIDMLDNTANPSAVAVTMTAITGAVEYSNASPGNATQNKCLELTSRFGAQVTAGRFNAKGGSTFNKALILSASHGSTTNWGLQIITDNSSESQDIRIESSTDEDDHFLIRVGADGATTISTVDDDGQGANLSFVVDGLMSMSGALGSKFIHANQRTGSPALLIDNNATGSIALDIDASNTIGHIVDVTGDSLQSGSILNLTSNSSNNGVRNLVKIHNDHASAQNTTCLYVLQDAIPSGGHDDNMGAAVAIETGVASQTEPVLALINTNADANGPILSFQMEAESSAADGDDIGIIKFEGYDSNDDDVEYAKILVEATDVTDSSTNGSIIFTSMVGNASTEVARINPLSYKATADSFMGGLGYRRSIYAAAEDGTLSGSMSGCTLTLADGVDVKLPTPAVGLHYKFVITGSLTTNATITSTTNGSTAEELMFGIVEVNGAPSSSALVKYDVLTFAGGTATAGDVIEVTCISTTTTGGNPTWHYQAYGDASGAITAT
jgi:hypothetical protein